MKRKSEQNKLQRYDNSLEDSTLHKYFFTIVGLVINPILSKLIQKISEKLSSLINYIEAVSFPGFGDFQAFDNIPLAHIAQTGKFYQMSSFEERKALKFLNDPSTCMKFVRYNARQLSRVYPSGHRQDSSNLNPMTPWNAGCQLGKRMASYLQYQKIRITFGYI